MKQPVEILTIKAASELTGLGEHAIRLALGQGRVPGRATLSIGERTARFILLEDAIEKWPEVAHKETDIERMRLHAPLIVAGDGVRFRLLHPAAPFLHGLTHLRKYDD